MTIKGFGPGLIIDGRPPTDYERETLTIYQEELAEVALECNAVIVKVSKLLRFGVGNTNPTTMLKNHVELSEEIGQLLAMTDRMAALPFYDVEAVRRGYKTKCEKLPTFTQYAPPCAMTDEELVKFADAFREGILDGGPSYMTCARVCRPLETLLVLSGVKCEAVESDLGEFNHVWLKLEDGRVLDPTIDRFNYLFAENWPRVYLGPPTKYHV